MTPASAELTGWVIAAVAGINAALLALTELRIMGLAHAREVDTLRKQLRTASALADEVMHLRVTGVVAKRG